MRADRLISILLLLQIHTRITARALAERLEVSERMILRDMEALSFAGIPVFAERGTGGVWSLTENYRTNLTGLNDNDVGAKAMKQLLKAGLFVRLGFVARFPILPRGNLLCDRCCLCNGRRFVTVCVGGRRRAGFAFDHACEA